MRVKAQYSGKSIVSTKLRRHSTVDEGKGTAGPFSRKYINKFSTDRWRKGMKRKQKEDKSSGVYPLPCDPGCSCTKSSWYSSDHSSSSKATVEHRGSTSLVGVLRQDNARRYRSLKRSAPIVVDLAQMVIAGYSSIPKVEHVLDDHQPRPFHSHLC